MSVVAVFCLFVSDDFVRRPFVDLKLIGVKIELSLDKDEIESRLSRD